MTRARDLTHATAPWMDGMVACPADDCPRPDSLWRPNKGNRVPMHRPTHLSAGRPCSGVGAVVTPLSAARAAEAGEGQ